MQIGDISTQLSVSIPDIYRSFLKKRNIDENRVAKFLYPKLEDLPFPQKMENLELAAQLVAKYILSKRTIIIWGDYDVDGITGAALLVNFFKELGVEVIWHIPDRLKEGYGLNVDWFIIQKKKQNIVNFLVITVDCGISNSEEIGEIQKNGGEVIVTDHHTIPEKSLPQCLILNPSAVTCCFHRENLSGVGVAFYLAAGIKAELHKTHLQSPEFLPIKPINLKKYLPFVALGTIADVVQLTETNRILVRGGIEAFENVVFPGLQELLKSSNLDDFLISSEDIAFVIGPKINAAGRLGCADLAMALLTTDDRLEAKNLSARLLQLNDERKAICHETLSNILLKINQTDIQNSKCLILRGVYHPGVIGIVAANLVELYKVPVFLFAEKKLPDGSLVYIGSGRSVPGVNITSALDSCRDVIMRYGGHEFAAGATIQSDCFERFAVRLAAQLKRMRENVRILPKPDHDITCSVDELMANESLKFFQLLEPFGPGNPAPIFYDEKAVIVDSRRVGQSSDHLHLSIRGIIANHKAIAFNFGHKITEVQQKPIRELYFTPTRNRYRGNVSWQIRVVDL